MSNNAREDSNAGRRNKASADLRNPLPVHLAELSDQDSDANADYVKE